jgi:hypothetical protein
MHAYSPLHDASLLAAMNAIEEGIVNGVKVLGLDEDGHVMFEANGIVNLTCETTLKVVGWYGLEDLDADERRAIGIVVH